VTVTPDVPNWAWHEYGMRVGFWRLLEALQKRKLRATTAINAGVCHAYPRVARAMLDAGWEFMGHGVRQGAMHLQPDQRAAIREAVQILEKFTGRPPRGWLGPGLTETWETLDHLREAGIEYVSDWVNDDQPYEIRTAHGPLVSVPYTLELNDIPVMVVQHHASPAWVERCRDQFDRLYAEGAKNPRVMAIAVHPYIHGVPHRIKYFEAVYDYIRRKKGVWFTTGEEIADCFRSGRA
jgi:allantoinase